MASIAAGDGVLTLSPDIIAPDFYDDSDGDDYADVPLLPSDSSPIQEIAGDVQATDASAMPVTEASRDQVSGLGILSIDKIDLRLPVVEGATKRNLKVAVGRVRQTANIGDIGNAVIAGHRSYTYGQYFNRLGEMEVGDIITYQPKEGETMRFEVYNIRTINPGDQSAFVQPDDSATMTLYTCTPIRKATHRLLIHAKLVTD